MADTRARSHATRSPWAVLAVLGPAQLMVVLDMTIVNVALPSAQRALGFSPDSRQWVITAYALAFGSLLLFGGKLGDLFGRKWTFIAGLIGFSGASAIGGFSQSFAMLVVARTLQGVFGALLAPSALSLLTVTFAGSPDRPKAFGVFGAIAGAGGSVGLLLGGVLTQTLSWRWCLYVNLLIAIPTAIVAWRILAPPDGRARPRIDIAGVLAASGGLFALVYGFSSAETSSWGAPTTIVALVLSPVLLAVFVAIEMRSDHPLLPLHIVTDRLRGSMYLAIALAISGTFGVFLFLTYYLQTTLHFSPIATGLAFMPMNLSIVFTSTLVQTRILPRIGPKIVVITGMSLGLLAMLWFAQIAPGDGYALRILPGLVLLGVGLGEIFAASFGTATLGVRREEAGVASAMVNTSQQVGGSVGASLLSTLFAGAAASFLRAHPGGGAALQASQIHGYSVAFWWATAIFAVGLAASVTIPPPRSRLVFAVAQPAPAVE